MDPCRGPLTYFFLSHTQISCDTKQNDSKQTKHASISVWTKLKTSPPKKTSLK